MTTPTPNDALWAITVTIPASVDRDDRDALYDAITDAAYDWEPEVRDGWDIDVSRGPVAPCPHVVTDPEGTSHCTLAEGTAAEVAALRAVVRDLGGGGQEPDDDEAARRLVSAWGGVYGWPPATVDAARRALTEDTPDTTPVCSCGHPDTDAGLHFPSCTRPPQGCATCGGTRHVPALCEGSGRPAEIRGPLGDGDGMCSGCVQWRPLVSGGGAVVVIDDHPADSTTPCPDCTEVTPDAD